MYLPSTYKNPVILKSDSHFPKKIVLFASMKPFKMMKNAFYFILKSLFVFKKV